MPMCVILHHIQIPCSSADPYAANVDSTWITFREYIYYKQIEGWKELCKKKIFKTTLYSVYLQDRLHYEGITDLFTELIC